MPYGCSRPIQAVENPGGTNGRDLGFALGGGVPNGLLRPTYESKGTVWFVVSIGIEPTEVEIFSPTVVITTVPVVFGGGISPWFGSLAMLLSLFFFLTVHSLVILPLLNNMQHYKCTKRKAITWTRYLKKNSNVPLGMPICLPWFLINNRWSSKKEKPFWLLAWSIRLIPEHMLIFMLV